MRIRRATLKDAPTLAEVHVTSWRKAYQDIVPSSHLEWFTVEKREAVFRENLEQDRKETYVAESDGLVAGFVTMGACRDEDIGESVGEIGGIYLAPQWWRKGIGSTLVAFAEKELAARGYREVTLWVLERNSAARRFYEAMGFRPDGGTKEVQLGAALSCVRYRKELAAHQ